MSRVIRKLINKYLYDGRPLNILLFNLESSDDLFGLSGHNLFTLNTVNISNVHTITLNQIKTAMFFDIDVCINLRPFKSYEKEKALALELNVPYLNLITDVETTKIERLFAIAKNLEMDTNLYIRPELNTRINSALLIDTKDITDKIVEVIYAN